MSPSRIRLIRVIARLNVGGPAKHVVWLTAGLEGSDFDSLLVAGSVPPGEEDMSYFADDCGVKPLIIPQMSREISIKDAITIWKLLRLFMREKPSIVHTHTAKAGTVGRMAGFCYRWLTPKTFMGRPRECKFVHTYHGHIFHSYYGPFKTSIFIFIERILARIVTDRIVVISEQQRREIHEEFHVGKPGQFRVIPLGLDLDAFATWPDRGKAFRNELGINDDTILIGIVGRLTEIKHHELFLSAVAKFKSQWSQTPPVKFVIIGDGSLRDRLQAQVQSLDLRNDVIFAGGRKDPAEFYPALDLVALTSRNEGTPLTLIEAMANARPVIATNVGGVIDLLGQTVQQSEGISECERGFGVTPNDANAFAAGMLRLVQNADLRKELGFRGLEFVRKNYGKERLLDDIKNLYRELIQQGAKSTGVHYRA